MGRLSGVQRPAIATPIPVPGSTPTVLLDAGANAECTPQYLVQFAQMGSVFAATRYGLDAPRVGLLSIGEEDSKGTPLVKETHALLRGGGAGVNFIGNVVLKTLEGGLKALVGAVAAAVGGVDGAIDALLPLAAEFDPDNTGGAMLLGVQGVCIISHGSSSATAVVNAVRVARDMVEGGVVDGLRSAVQA
jgi:glycerol-3-phosphate acyltransferase PlsX